MPDHEPDQKEGAKDGPKDGKAERAAYWKQKEAETFAALQADLPGLLDGTSPMALGSHGYAVDHGDGTVSKVFLRHDKAENQAYADQIFKDELKIMQLLGGRTIAGAQTPAVHSHAELPGSTQAFATYRMTKLEGREIDWQSDLETMSVNEIRHHFSSAGRFLARFHAEATPLVGGFAPAERGFSWGTHIEQVDALDDKTNALLAKCDQYLKDNMEPGVCHGDFHPRNFKVNDAYDVTGVFDLSFAGMHPNRLMDFSMMPHDGAQHAMKAYERAGGKPVDPTMLALTQISQDTAVLNWHTAWPQPGSDDIIKDRFKNLSERLDFVKDAVMQAESTPSQKQHPRPTSPNKLAM